MHLSVVTHSETKFYDDEWCSHTSLYVDSYKFAPFFIWHKEVWVDCLGFELLKA